MALIPAFCDSCGTVFGATNVIGGSARGITMMGNKVGPCPVCGGMASIPDGVYQLADDALTGITPTPEWRERLQRAVTIVEEARARGAEAEEVRDELEREAPELTPVINVFVERAGDQWAQWLTVLLAFLQVLLAYLALHQRTDLNSQDVDRVVNGVGKYLEDHPQPPLGR